MSEIFSLSRLWREKQRAVTVLWRLKLLTKMKVHYKGWSLHAAAVSQAFKFRNFTCQWRSSILREKIAEITVQALQEIPLSRLQKNTVLAIKRYSRSRNRPKIWKNAWVLLILRMWIREMCNTAALILLRFPIPTRDQVRALLKTSKAFRNMFQIEI